MNQQCGRVDKAVYRKLSERIGLFLICEKKPAAGARLADF
jgi:hypothetical protein